MRIPHFSAPKPIESIPKSQKKVAGADGTAKADSKKAMAGDLVERSAQGTSELYGANAGKKALPAKDKLHAEHELLLNNNTPLGIVNKVPDALDNPALVAKIAERYGTKTAVETLQYAIEQKKLRYPGLNA